MSLPEEDGSFRSLNLPLQAVDVPGPSETDRRSASRELTASIEAFKKHRSDKACRARLEKAITTAKSLISMASATKPRVRFSDLEELVVKAEKLLA